MPWWAGRQGCPVFSTMERHGEWGCVTGAAIVILGLPETLALQQGVEPAMRTLILQSNLGVPEAEGTRSGSSQKTVGNLLCKLNPSICPRQLTDLFFPRFAHLASL